MDDGGGMLRRCQADGLRLVARGEDRLVRSAEGLVEGLVEDFPGQRNGGGRALGQCDGPDAGGPDQIVQYHRAIHQPDGQRLGAFDRATRMDRLRRVRDSPAAAGQEMHPPPSGTRPRSGTPIDIFARAIGGDDEIAGHRPVKAMAERRVVHRGTGLLAAAVTGGDATTGLLSPPPAVEGGRVLG